MNAPRLLLRGLGRRLPVTRGSLNVDGLSDSVTIRRDRFGIPHIEATSDLDGWFGLGFCQGQDRAFQIETRTRLVRGTLAALVGADAIALDRLSRRIGFSGSGRRSLDALPVEQQRRFEAFAAGIREGMKTGRGARSHEFVLLRTAATPFTAADALGFLAVQSFALASNWDSELARLRMLALDGADAVRDLHPAYPEGHPVSIRPGDSARRVVDALAADLERAGDLFTAGGGSNNWAVAGTRTTSGAPILANDPHLAPVLPPHWYLAHVETPEWSIVGGSIPATPAFGFGHNGHAAWGVTAGLIDNTDLFIEEIGPDGASVRRGSEFIPCEVRSEAIEVKGARTETIEVLETDRGPIVGPAFEGPFGALSMAATWMNAGSVDAILDIGRIRSFDELHERFAGWSSVPLNIAYADTSGSIGWQLIGSAPIRSHGNGTIPMPGTDSGWQAEPVPYEDMPRTSNPKVGYIATANNLPSDSGPYLGSDFLDGYRAARISEQLESRDDWTVPAILDLQMDQVSIPWREMRPLVLQAASAAGDLGVAADLLREWDGEVSADSPAAALFELFVAEMSQTVAAARAPHSTSIALGAGFTPLVPSTSLLVRRVGHLVRLLTQQPDGWFPQGWDETMRSALRAALARLTDARGPDPSRWAWGAVRTLTLVHPMGLRRPLDKVWNIGPLSIGGDANTINPAPVDPADPLGNPDFAVASGRMVVEVGAWDHARFCLPGGQSGNPYSMHYNDQISLWLEGDAIVIPCSPTEVARTTRRTLTLVPANA